MGVIGRTLSTLNPDIPMETNNETVSTLLKTGAAMAAPVLMAGGEPYAVVPNGYAIQNLAHLLPPTRVKQCALLVEAGSFCDYVKRYKNPDTMIFAQVTSTGATLTAVIDYHGAADEAGKVRPEYCAHLAKLELVQTPDWTAWCRADRQPMEQVTFASWLEDHAYLFNSVKDGALKGADLLALVQTLTGKSEVNFTSKMNLKNGATEYTYEEVVNVQGTTVSGKMEMPGLISAALQPYHGGPVYQVDARLKTRIEGRKLRIWFETVQLDKIIRDSVLDTVKMVAEQTGIVPLLGKV